MDKITRFVNWIAVGDCDQPLSNQALITKLVIFAIRMITIAVLLYALQIGLGDKVVDILRGLGALWMAKITRLGG